MNLSLSLRTKLRAGVVLLAFGAGAAASAATPQSAAAPVPDTTEQRVAACASCHGAHGAGAPDNVLIPRLAGKPAGYLLQQLEYFQTGQRQHGPM
jgi:cytochrome c553